MSAFVPNALVRVFKEGTAGTTDSWGYPEDNASPPASAADAFDLPVYIAESAGVRGGGAGQTDANPGSGAVTWLRKYTVRARPKAFPFDIGDRIQDQATGLMYLVDLVASTTGVVQANDIKLICKRVE